MSAEVHVTFLGGLGDIGRNCAAIETEDALVILDCGQLFAGEDRPGVDSILPDLDYLWERRKKVVGLITTHGHEDHIGAIAPLFDMGVTCPIYGSPFTLGLVRHRLDERGLASKADFQEVGDHETRQIGPFSVEFLPVTHSVPGGYISSITTPQGVILHSSDFKLDLNPIDNRLTDLPRIEDIARDPGVRLLLADSTNADNPGSTRSESEIGPSIETVFADNQDRRIICAAFSSHVHRVQQIVDAALDSGRKVATLGLSMKRNVGLARSLGILKIPDPSIVDIADVDDYPPEELCVIATGAQGEDRAALAQAASGRSRWLTITDRDAVILSSYPIPGNESKVARVINNLVDRGAVVVDSVRAGVHTSGHGKRDELAALHNAASPEFFAPVHGEPLHLRSHAGLAEELGMSADAILQCRDGDRIVLSDGGATVKHGVRSGVHLLVHGPFVGPHEGAVDDRLVLGQHGFVNVTVAVDLERGELLAGPLVYSRGWVEAGDAEGLHGEISGLVDAVVEKALVDPEVDRAELSRRIRRTTGQFVNDSTGRRPMILPTVLDH